MTETLANGYSSDSTQRELSNEYQHDRVLIICVIVRWMKVALASPPSYIYVVISRGEPFKQSPESIGVPLKKLLDHKI